MSEKNTEYWDFCKAENSDEEDNISDLQSRLYAEIYYSSEGQDQWNTKNTMKTDLPHSDEGLKSENTIHKASQKVANTSESSGRSACPNVGQIIEVANNDDNSKITPSYNTDGNGKSPVEVDDKSELNTLNTGMLEKHACKISENATIQNSKVSHQDTTNVKVIPDLHQQCNTSKKELAKHKSELENQEDLNPVEPTCPTVGSAKIDKSPLNCSKSVQSSSGKGKKKGQSKEDNGADNQDDILTKYSFSKTFINKLYLQKYQNLNKTLEDGLEENQNLNLHSIESEMNSRYHVLEKSKKLTVPTEVTVLSSETESDSEVSILEVPIPPKPKPPVIHLKDSDESSSSDSDADHEDWSMPNEKDNNTGSDQLPHTKDDIVLNCTEVQKGATSIMEIREMSKNTQLEQCSQTDKNLSGINKSGTTNETSNTNAIESSEGLSRHIVEDLQEDEICINQENNSLPSSLFAHQIDRIDAIHDKDVLNSSYDFTKDVSITNQWSPEPRKNRKRHRENENDTGSSAKQKKYDNNENMEASTSTAQDHNTRKNNKEETWEEYIFRPMSKKLKAFYNSSRGQENFDVGAIQRKMPKDPRLWAILDEDLMPNASKRNRFWNVRCSHCHRNGHQRYNCPEPHKPPQCHMCGTQGHIETRCPEKMCLTCGKKQSTFRKTCEACRLLHCNMCKAVGHKSTECPDLWRRFHQTTQNCELNIPENLNEVMKPADLLYCCNCTKRGHDSSMCHEYRWSPHFPTPAFVSNYLDGSGYDDYLNTTLREGDFLPLSKRSKKVDTRSCSNVMFLPEKNNDLPNCRTIYSCGSFYTTKHDGQQILKNITGEKSYHLKGLLAGRVAPTFLEDLLKIVPFEITIFYDAKGQLMLRIRSKSFGKVIGQILVFWFELQEDEKDRLIRVDLPRKRKEMFEFLQSEWSKLEKSSPNPKYLEKLIKQCKRSLTDPEECPVELHKIKNRMKTLQATLVRVYNTKPTLSPKAQELKFLINQVSGKSMNDVKPRIFLRIILYYNQVFMPYTIPRKALDDFYVKYYRAQENISTGNKQMNPYEKFKAGLVNYNKSVQGKNQAQIPVHIRCSDNNIQTRSMTCRMVNTQVLQHIRKQTPEERLAIDKDSCARNISDPNETFTEFPCNQEIPYTSGTVEIHRGTPTLKKISSNLITIPLKEFPSTVTASKQSNHNKSDILCIDIENTPKDMGKQSEVINNNERVPAKQYNSNCDDSTSKKKQSNRNNSNITCINVESTSRDIENQSEITTNCEKITEQDVSNCDANTRKKKQSNRSKSNIIYTAVEGTSKKIQKQLETINDHEKVAAEQDASKCDANTSKKKQSNRNKSNIICTAVEGTSKDTQKQLETVNDHEKVAAEQDASNCDANTSKKKQSNRNKPNIICTAVEGTSKDIQKQLETINDHEKGAAEQDASKCDANTSKKKQSNRNKSNIICTAVEGTSKDIQKQLETINEHEKGAAEQDDSNCDANTSKKKQSNRNKSNIICTAVEGTSKDIQKQLEPINDNEKVAAEQGHSNYDASATKKKQFDHSESNITCVNKESTQKNTKNQPEISNKNENVTSEQDNSNCDVSPSKKKKKKKSKKSKTKESQQDDAGQSEFDNICDLVVINRANEAIHDALAFQIPYMSNAAAEVQKRVTDKTIKQEHVDVLRKLVDLENDHQKHVTSFCSYLK